MKLLLLLLSAVSHQAGAYSVLAIRYRSTRSAAVSLLAISVENTSNSDTKDGPHDESPVVTKSQILSIRSRNLAGVVNSESSAEEENRDIHIPFQDGQNLVAVMGETGSGKSLLVARVVELLTGGKASSSFVAAQQSSAFVEMEIALREPFLSAAYNVFAQLDLDTSLLATDGGKIVLSRSLLAQPSENGNNRKRSSPIVKSTGRVFH